MISCKGGNATLFRSNWDLLHTKMADTMRRCKVSNANLETRGGTRTHNLLLRREAPYPLGHTSMGTGDRRTDNVSFERIYGKSS